MPKAEKNNWPVRHEQTPMFWEPIFNLQLFTVQFLVDSNLYNHNYCYHLLFTFTAYKRYAEWISYSL